jgi:hypothetical protein
VIGLTSRSLIALPCSMAWIEIPRSRFLRENAALLFGHLRCRTTFGFIVRLQAQDI